MELEGFVTGLAIATGIGFVGAVVAIVDCMKRINELERNQAKIVKIGQVQHNNLNTVARSVHDLVAMRKHWLGLVKS